MAQSIIHPDDRARYAPTWSPTCAHRDDHFESEYRVADKRRQLPLGTRRGLAHRGRQAGARCASSASISDITARKRAEEQLKAERDFSRGLIDSLPAPFFLFDAQGRLVLWNRFVSELTGLDATHLQKRRGRQPGDPRAGGGDGPTASNPR